MSRNKAPQPARAETALDWRRCLVMLRAQSTLVCCIVLAASFCGLAVSYVLPKKYEASTTVFIEQNVISDLVKGIAITPSIDSKLRILKVSLLSRNMLLGVLRELDMDLGLDTLEKQESFLDRVRANVEIQHEERKGLFVIAYTDKVPARARDFVNTLTRRYIEESTSSKRKESIDATSFLAEQIKVFQKRIEQAQHDIDTFKADKGMYLGLNEFVLRDQIRAAEQRLDEIRIRKNECQAKLNLTSQSGQLRKTLEEKELLLQSLRASYTERHPLVVRTRENIKALGEAVKAEEEKEARDSQDNVEYQKVKVELQSLESMEASLTGNIDKNTQYLQELPEIRTELASLEQRKHNESLIYEQLVSRYGQSEVSKQMELQDKSVSFNIIDAAVLPTAYKSPPRFLIIIGSMVAGLGLAGGIVLLRELLRPRVRGRADLDALGLEVLATLPPAVETRGETSPVAWKLPALTCALLVLFLAVAAAEFLRLPYVESAFRLLANLI